MTDSLQHTVVPLRAGLPASDPFGRWSGATGTPLPLLSADMPYWHPVRAEEVFGAASTRAAEQPVRDAHPVSLTQDAIFQGFVLLLAVAYVLLLYRHFDDIRRLFRIVSENRSNERLTADQGNIGFSRLIRVAVLLGLLFMGVAAVKYTDLFFPDFSAEMHVPGAVLGFSLFATLVFAAGGLFEAGLLRLSGAVTLLQPVTGRLLRLKGSYFAMAVILTAPVLLLFVFCAPHDGVAWSYVLITLLLIVSVFFFLETLNSFASKKISILYWILYFCAVELFPISFLWLIVVRYAGE